MVAETAGENDGRMTVAGCRAVQGACEARQNKRWERALIDLALIKRHLGINGQYEVHPHPNHRDGEQEEHGHFREEDIQVSHRGDRKDSWLKQNWWALALAAIAGERLLSELPKAVKAIAGALAGGS